MIYERDLLFNTDEHVELEEQEEFIAIAFRVFYIDKLRNSHSELYLMRVGFDSVERNSAFILDIDLVDENYSCCLLYTSPSPRD